MITGSFYCVAKQKNVNKKHQPFQAQCGAGKPAVFCFPLLLSSFCCRPLHCFAQSNFQYCKNKCIRGKQDMKKMILSGVCCCFVRTSLLSCSCFVRLRANKTARTPEQGTNMVRSRYGKGGLAQLVCKRIKTSICFLTNNT